jgi:hypothetical protein
MNRGWRVQLVCGGFSAPPGIRRSTEPATQPLPRGKM